VEILIKIHDCWEGDEILVTREAVLLFDSHLDRPSPEDAFDYILDKLVMVYNFDNATKTWTWYNPDWPADQNTIEYLYEDYVYWVKVSADCILLWGNQSYDLYAGWNSIIWLGY